MSGADAGEPQVAWIACETGATILAADGSEIGHMKQVAGDETHDIFDGLVVSHGTLEGDRYIAAERVKGIWPNRVQTDLTTEEAASLPPYQESKVTEWHADQDNGFGARVKRAWHALIGRR